MRRKIEPNELKKIIEDHGHWVREDCDDWINMRANLSGANLIGANLSDADLIGADLSGANLSDAKGVCHPLACPDTGAFIGWKKCRNDVIVMLLIPEDARRSSATTQKCRCDKAVVLELQNIDGTPSAFEAAESQYAQKFVYKPGETVSVDNFDENRWEECAPGIHFFINREEAVRYG